MKVLLSAYACDPELGSEERNGWYLALNLALLGHQVWVLSHTHSKPAAERALQTVSLPNLHLEFIADPKWARRFIPKTGWQLLYLIWQHSAYKAARELDTTVNFDIIHHITWGSLQGGSPLWRLNKPFIFGPVGGFQVAPPAFKRYFLRYWHYEAARSYIITHLIPRFPFIFRSTRQASLVLAANRETMVAAEQLGARRLELCLDSALPQDFIPMHYPERDPSGSMNLIWVGRLLPRKALNLALEAFARVDPRLPIRLQVLGGGSLNKYLEEWLQEPGVKGRIDYLGQVSWLEVRQQMLNSDALLFTSLRDTCGVQILEAMALGLPIITLNHQGAREIVPDGAGIKIPALQPEDTVKGIVAAIEKLYHNPDLRRLMGRQGWLFARRNTWPHRAKQMEAYYQSLLDFNRTTP